MVFLAGRVIMKKTPPSLMSRLMSHTMMSHTMRVRTCRDQAQKKLYFLKFKYSGRISKFESAGRAGGGAPYFLKTGY